MSEKLPGSRFTIWFFEEDSNVDSEGMEEQTKTANVDISDPQALFTEIYSRVCLNISQYLSVKLKHDTLFYCAVLGNTLCNVIFKLVLKVHKSKVFKKWIVISIYL